MNVGFPDIVASAIGEIVGALKLRMVEWQRAAAWRRSVQAVLSESSLTFMQWLVLDTTRELVRATEDAVSQGDVAAHLDMSRAVVSEAMIALERRGLVSRGPAAEGPAWRVFLDDEGEALLAQLDPRIAAVSKLH